MKQLFLLLFFGLFFAACNKDNDNMNDANTNCDSIDLETFEGMEVLLTGTWDVRYVPYSDGTAINQCEGKPPYIITLDSLINKASTNIEKAIAMSGRTSGGKIASGTIINSFGNIIILFTVEPDTEDAVNYFAPSCDVSDCNNIKGLDACGDYFFKKLR